MRSFDYSRRYRALLTPDIVMMLTEIHERKGEQSLFIQAKTEDLTQLEEITKVQSTEASNQLAGISVPDERTKKLVLDKTTPRTRDEREIAGYRDVLAAIHKSYDYIPPTPSEILQLHRNLYKYSGSSMGGTYKSSGSVMEKDARETPEAMERLCKSFVGTLRDPSLDPIILVPLFILDFLCIRPFDDGNGRLSRLLTLLLLCRSGYVAGKYVSMEKIIERMKETYYEALRQSSEGWHEGVNNDAPFVASLLGVILKSYRNFSQRVQALTASGLSKPERIRDIIKATSGTVTKAEILQKFPDISQITVQRTLIELQKSGEIIKLSGGRYTAYTWNRERE